MNDGSVSDLYYHEESKTVKNHKHEVIAYFDSSWNVLDEHLVDTYCQDISNALKSTFQGSQDNYENLILIAKKKISKLKKQKMQKDGLLKNAAIALDLDPQSLKPIQNRFLNILKNIK